MSIMCLEAVLGLNPDKTELPLVETKIDSGTKESPILVGVAFSIKK